MKKVYVGWQKGEFGSSGYLKNVSLDRFALVKHSLEVERDQNMDIEVFDLDTMMHLYDCSCLQQHSDKGRWCNCEDCKSNDETVRYLVDTHQGNYLK